MDCPQCRLYNPAETERCDCGYTLVADPPASWGGLGLGLTVMDWGICLLLPPLGFLLGLIRLLTGQPTARTMLIFSFAGGLLWLGGIIAISANLD